MTGIARLYTPSETVEVLQMVPLCELDARLAGGLGNAVVWASQTQTCCVVCDAPMNSLSAYLVVLLPSEPEAGLGVSGAVCTHCGGLPRSALQAHAERVALLLFGEVAGHG
jgi:hypothetical protein